MADVGTGTTIVFATSGFSAEIISVSLSDISRAEVDVTHMSSTVKSFMPGDLVNWGSVEMEILFDPDTIPPIDQAAESVTVTFPIPSGKSAGATAVGSAFLTKASGTIPLEDAMKMTCTLKWAGAVTFTDATA